MNPIAPLLTLCLLLMPSGKVLAQQTIAVMSIENAIIASDYAQQQLQALEKTELIQNRLKKFNALNKELQDLQKTILANELTSSAEEKESQQKQFKEKLDERNVVGKNLELEKQALLRKIQQQLLPRVNDIVPKIVEEKKIDMLVDANAVHFVAEPYNLTQELINRLNAVAE
ncbi:MAG: OmpH family outer membrane protein [Cellvibrionaceae bacterium]|nr:OmpH family outer membrane protein [Cellvibrionaceae bacterium]